MIYPFVFLIKYSNAFHFVSSWCQTKQQNHTFLTFNHYLLGYFIQASYLLTTLANIGIVVYRYWFIWHVFLFYVQAWTSSYNQYSHWLLRKFYFFETLGCIRLLTLFTKISWMLKCFCLFVCLFVCFYFCFCFLFCFLFCFVLFCFVLFCFVLFCFVLFCFVFKFLRAIEYKYWWW